MEFRDYGYKENPFNIDSLNYEMRGRKEELKRIKHLLEDSLESSGVKWIFLLGDYQSGKTFTLEKITESLNTNEYKGSNKAIIASIRLAESEPESKIGKSFVTKVFLELGFEKLVEISKKAKIPKGKSFSQEFINILDSLKKGKKEAYEWLTGESLSQKEKNDIGVKRLLSTTSQAMRVFYEFETFLKICGYKNLVILIDEFEYLVSQYSEKQVTTLLHIFKEIYDNFIRVNTKKEDIVNCIFMIAMTPKSWDYLIEMEQKMSKSKGGGGISPFLERAKPEKYLINLEPLNKQSLIKMIEDRLEDKRIKYKEFPYPTFPFINPDFFEFIHGISLGIPGKALRYSDLIFDYASKESIKEIGKKEAKNILEKFGIVPS
ncbi:ATP-binding protein [Candidatus Pacearchaeota archaeon]|nr:ATP-binding protein [Candidatus Pacearchaeota archaeon]